MLKRLFLLLILLLVLFNVIPKILNTTSGVVKENKYLILAGDDKTKRNIEYSNGIFKISYNPSYIIEISDKGVKKIDEVESIWTGKLGNFDFVAKGKNVYHLVDRYFAFYYFKNNTLGVYPIYLTGIYPFTNTYFYEVELIGK